MLDQYQPSVIEAAVQAEWGRRDAYRVHEEDRKSTRLNSSHT